MLFTLEQLRCFVAVANHLHFGKAAAELSMTQPPLSRQIQKLEKIVGATLLDRDNRKVELTTAGFAFLKDARLILNSTEKAAERARLASSGMWGQLNIGYTAAAGFSILGPTLNQLHEKMPGVSVDLFEMVSTEQIAALESGLLDLGVGRLSSPVEGLQTRRLQADSLVLAAPKGHPLLDQDRPLLRKHLTGVPFLQHSPTKAKYLYDIVVRNFTINDAQVQHTLSQITTMVSLVASGLGVALVPESAKKLNYSGVEYRHFYDLPVGLAELQAIYSTSNDNPAVRKFIKNIDDTF
ncbi:LysR family transcriptional regulator [Corynebacterium glutamicum]|uniref:LysR substrate-binding domain-containing protein n=1 Tax=Corynebacterium glutamicum TaxID=1718 RepID=UPI001C6F3CF9|nr:LysR substrate-binding domain-containing protein [Corynebacterium glutamicum]QYR17962.1 LysR family transcriptional regulator [Corynebacterium glutamicum]